MLPSVGGRSIPFRVGVLVWMDITDHTMEDMIAGDWTLNVMCGDCERIVEFTPNHFRRHNAYAERIITKMRFRCTKRGEQERFKLTTFNERFRGDRSSPAMMALTLP